MGVRRGLIEKVTFVQRFEGSGEGVKALGCEAVLGKNIVSRGNGPCGDPEAGLSLVLKHGMSGRTSWRNGWRTAGLCVGLLSSSVSRTLARSPVPVSHGWNSSPSSRMIMVGRAVSPGVARMSPGHWRPMPAGALQCRHLATPSTS